MKINDNLYPYNNDARKLPVHLTGIGGSEYQYHVIRNEGYHWYQVLLSSSGCGVLKYDNTTVTIDEGDVFFLPAGYPHEYYTENDNWVVRWMAFDGYACAHILSQFSMTAPVVIKPKDSSVLKKLYSKMYTLQKTDRFYGDYYCSGYIYACIIEFHKLMDTRENRLRSDRFRTLTPVLDYIDEQPLKAECSISTTTAQDSGNT